MSTETSKLAPVQEIGYSFLRQYYTRLHDDPKTLHHLYAEKANVKCINFPFLKDDQTHFLPQTTKITGKANLADFYNQHETKIKELRLRIDTHEVQSTGADDSGVFIMAMGEMCWKQSPSYRFVQTFILKYVTKNVFDVTNDLIKFIPDDIVPKVKRVPVSTLTASAVSAQSSKPATFTNKPQTANAQSTDTKGSTPTLPAATEVNKDSKNQKETDSSEEYKPKAQEKLNANQVAENIKTEENKGNVLEKETTPVTTFKKDDFQKNDFQKEEKKPEKEIIRPASQSKLFATGKKEEAKASSVSTNEKDSTPTLSPYNLSGSPLSSPTSRQSDDNDDFKTIVYKKSKNKNKDYQQQQTQNSDNEEGYTVAGYGTKHGVGNGLKPKKPNANRFGTFPVYIPKTNEADEEPLKNALKSSFGTIGRFFQGVGYVIADFEEETAQRKALEIGSVQVAPGRSFKIEQKTERKRVSGNVNNNSNGFTNNSPASSDTYSVNGPPSANNLYRSTGSSSSSFTTVTSSGGFTPSKTYKKPNYKKN